MAKVDLTFLCVTDGEECTIITKSSQDLIKIQLYEKGRINEIHLDISTAIKFAKTLRTEINKAKEVTNV